MRDLMVVYLISGFVEQYLDLEICRLVLKLVQDWYQVVAGSEVETGQNDKLVELSLFAQNKVSIHVLK